VGAPDSQLPGRVDHLFRHAGNPRDHLFVAMVYVFLTLAVDLLQAALDPRIRLR
jgi:hypothetical protein